MNDSQSPPQPLPPPHAPWISNQLPPLRSPQLLPPPSVVSQPWHVFNRSHYVHPSLDMTLPKPSRPPLSTEVNGSMPPMHQHDDWIQQQPPQLNHHLHEDPNQYMLPSLLTPSHMQSPPTSGAQMSPAQNMAE